MAVVAVGSAREFVGRSNGIAFAGVLDMRCVIGMGRIFARLFLVPGLYHCAGGPGPTTFDFLTPLTQWVEAGVPPDRVVASHVESGATTFTRPLCPYPTNAFYSGSGPTTDASSFVCR